MTEIEIGRAKRARRAYAFDDIAVVPSRRTRDPEVVSVKWAIDAYQFSTPILAAPMDSVVSPATAITLGRLGALGVLDLEGLWTRYEDPEPLLAEIRGLMNQVIRRLERVEGDLLSERHARVDDLGLLVDLITSSWKSVERRLTTLERKLQTGEGAIVYRMEERRTG